MKITINYDKINSDVFNLVSPEGKNEMASHSNGKNTTIMQIKITQYAINT